MNPDIAFESILRGYKSGRLAHGYVIEGLPQGIGREFTDRCLRMLFCMSGVEQGCGQCKGCIQAGDHTHADLIWIEPQKKSRIISVEQIRSIDARVYKTSFSGGWKACVINFADRLHESAANAFLKTLEEPPARTLFFLITDSPQSLLPTILSRCQRIALSGADGRQEETWRDVVVEILERTGKGKPSSDFALADRLLAIFKALRAEAEREAVAEEESEDMDEAVWDALVNARYLKVRTDVLRFIIGWYRDLYILVVGGDDDGVINADRMESLRAKAAVMNYRRAQENIAAIDDMVLQFERNMPEGVVLSYGFGRLY